MRASELSFLGTLNHLRGWQRRRDGSGIPRARANPVAVKPPKLPTPKLAAATDPCGRLTTAARIGDTHGATSATTSRPNIRTLRASARGRAAIFPYRSPVRTAERRPPAGAGLRARSRSHSRNARNPCAGQSRRTIQPRSPRRMPPSLVEGGTTQLTAKFRLGSWA